MPDNAPIAPNPKACLFCRSKHLKCDAKQPACSRCASINVDCVYVQSRRGHVGGRRKQIDQPAQTARTPNYIPGAPAASGANDGNVFTDQQSPSGTAQTPSSDSTISLPRATALHSRENHLIDVFYGYIHPAHPFIIPRKLYMQDPSILPGYLKRAMRFIASHVSHRHGEDVGTISDIINTNMPADGFKVQTYLVLTIASYARCERGQGDMTLLQATNTAHQIGMQLEVFGSSDAPIMQESWRRTWWELYTIASLIRVLTPTTTGLDAAFHKVLPSEDSDYDDCRAIESRTLDDMQDRSFTDDSTQYSSFAYRIEGARILNDVMETTQQNSYQPDPAFKCLAASIRSYLLSLPSPKRTATIDGKPDELMSCALMTINLASILLHLPRSGLGNVQSFQTICATDRPTMFLNDEDSHIGSAMRAADAITQLLIDRDLTAMQTLSPCFSCSIAFAVTVQLSAYCMGQKQERARCLREYIQLSLSALDNIGQSWAVAKVVKGQLADFARETLKRPKPTRRQIATVQEELGSIAMPLPLEAAPTFALEDDFWLRSFVEDPLNYSFIAQG